MHAAGCPSREQLSAFLLGHMPLEEADRVARHLVGCPSCTSAARSLQQPAGSPTARGHELPPPAEALPQVSAAEPTGLPGTSTTRTLPLQQLGDYKLLEKLGAGGMGTVYKALHTKLGRIVALKVLPKQHMADNRAVARFQREMMAVGALDHPNIVRATDASEAEGTHFLVMEFVEGLDLSELVRSGGPLPVADACELVRQTALGLECARQHGLVHRDIKPSNVMLARSGQAKLLDLGLARFQFDEPAGPQVTAAGQAVGTADYIAPEQVSDSHTVDIRADIYSLGCTFHELLSGHPPFSGSKYRSVFDKMTAHVNEPLPPIGDCRSDVPDELAAVLNRMVSKDPADRLATPAEVAEALAPFRAGCDLARLLELADRRTAVSAGTPRASAGTDPQHGSALAGTHPEAAAEPAADLLPARRRNLLAVAVGLVLLAVAASWIFAVILRNTRDSREEVPPLPRGSEVRVPEKAPIGSALPAEQKQPAGSPSQTGRSLPETPGAKTTQEPIVPPSGLARVEPSLPPPPPDGPTPPDTPALGPEEPSGSDIQPESVAASIKRQPPEVPPGSPLSGMALVAEPEVIEGVGSWTVETRAHRGAVQTAAYSPDARLMATGGTDGMIRLWESNTGELVQILVGHDDAVTCLAWAPDSSALASGAADRSIKLWEVTSGLELCTLRGHFGKIHSLAWSPDGRNLGSAAADGSARLWDIAAGQRVPTLRGNDGRVYCVGFSPDGRMLIAGGGQGLVRVWEAESGRAVRTLAVPSVLAASAAFSPGGEILAVACSTSGSVGSVQLWDLASQKPPTRLPGRLHGENCLAFSPDGELLAAGGPREDGICVWDVAAAELRRTLKEPSGTSSTCCVGFSPDAGTLIAGGSRGWVQLWEPISGRVVRTLPAHCGAATSVAFSADEGTVACGYLDGTVRLWRTDTGEPVHHLSPDLGAVGQVAWSADGKMLASSYRSSGLVDVWDNGTGERITRLSDVKGPVENLAFSPDGKALAVGGGQVQL